jgi:hypothetical protein
VLSDVLHPSSPYRPKSIYIVGSLRNPSIPMIGEALRNLGLDVFDDWYAAGPEADDKWRDYEVFRGRNYPEALGGFAAKHVFEFDLFHLQRTDMCLLVLPAGKSGHMELGYARGLGKRCFVLFDKVPERYDVMYQFADGGVFFALPDLLKALEQ